MSDDNDEDPYMKALMAVGLVIAAVTVGVYMVVKSFGRFSKGDEITPDEIDESDLPKKVRREIARQEVDGDVCPECGEVNSTDRCYHCHKCFRCEEEYSRGLCHSCYIILD